MDLNVSVCPDCCIWSTGKLELEKPATNWLDYLHSIRIEYFWFKSTVVECQIFC